MIVKVLIEKLMHPKGVIFSHGKWYSKTDRHVNTSRMSKINKCEDSNMAVKEKTVTISYDVSNGKKNVCRSFVMHGNKCVSGDYVAYLQMMLGIVPKDAKASTDTIEDILSTMKE